jgi:perosamine synthetase
LGVQCRLAAMLTPIPLSQPFLSELEASYVNEAIHSGWLTQSGSYVGLMESIIKTHIHGNDPLSVVTSTSNGTTALHLVLMSIGVGPGDEVIVPNFGYIAPVNTVLMCGATPVIVDVDKKTWCIDPKLVLAATTERTKAVVVIDNYGMIANIPSIRGMIPKHIKIIQDASESFPSLPKSYQGSFTGDFVTTSFYANKVITSGEGGAIAGPPEYLDKINSLKNQSVKSKGAYEHIDIGYNYRISNLHAALFCAQWKRLPHIIENRIRVFDRYFKRLSHEGISFESNQYSTVSNPWLMAIRLPDSAGSINSLRNKLLLNGIETRPGFKPASQHKYLEGRVRIVGSTENSDSLYSEIICLPTYPELANDQVDFICSALSKSLTT